MPAPPLPDVAVSLPPVPVFIAVDMLPPLPSAPPVPPIMSPACASSLVLHASSSPDEPTTKAHPSFATVMQPGVASMSAAPDSRGRRSEHHVVPLGRELQ